MDVEIDRRRASLVRWPAEPRQLDLIDAVEAFPILRLVFDEHRRRQHGQVERPEHFWRAWLTDPDRRRRGAGERFIAVARHDGRATGYVSYRYALGYPPDADHRALIIEDLIACDPETRAAIWRYCLGIDLVRSIRCANVSPDESVRWLMEDARALRVHAVDDFLWLRPIDVSRTLAGRRYATSDALTIHVDDPFLPSNTGCYRLESAAGRATCTRTTRPPDIRLGASELGERSARGGSIHDACERRTCGRAVRGGPSTSGCDVRSGVGSVDGDGLVARTRAHPSDDAHGSRCLNFVVPDTRSAPLPSAVSSDSPHGESSRSRFSPA